MVRDDELLRPIGAPDRRPAPGFRSLHRGVLHLLHGLRLALGEDGGLKTGAGDEK